MLVLPGPGRFGTVGGGASQRPNSRIDGFTITGADTGGVQGRG